MRVSYYIYLIALRAVRRARVEDALGKREEGKREEGNREEGALGHSGGHLGAIWEVIWEPFGSSFGGHFPPPLGGSKFLLKSVICPVRAPHFEPSSGALFHLGFGQKASKFRCSKRGSPACSGGSSLGRKSSPGSPPHARD